MLVTCVHKVTSPTHTLQSPAPIVNSSAHKVSSSMHTVQSRSLHTSGYCNVDEVESMVGGWEEVLLEPPRF